MPINLSQERIITFGELARSLPKRRRNKPVHTATVHRWRSRGLRGIRLEAVRIGGAWHTSWEAFARFTARLTVLAEEVSGSLPRNSSAAISESLRKEGW